MKITADTITKLLREKHAADVFVAECKTGPSQNARHLRLDAWAMERSWANPRTIGYEIKVSRSDFLHDTKWRAYTAYCNEFSFVCPPGLIQPDELPTEIGLLYTASTGTRLFIKRRAQHRQVDIPEDLWRYILMCRTKVSDYDLVDDSRVDVWRRWINGQAEWRDIGYMVSRKIQKHVSAVDVENARLKQENQRAQEVVEVLKKHGLYDGYLTPWNVERKIADLKRAVPPELLVSLERVKNESQIAMAQLKKIGIEV